MFVVYDVIYRRKATLGYSLLIKLGMWEKTKELIYEIIYARLTVAATKIKETNRCTNVAILTLERQIQTIAAYALHLYARYFQFKLRLKDRIVANNMLVFWITFNPADLRYPLVIYLAGIELELPSKIQSVFWLKITIMNPVVIIKYFHIIYDIIFMSLLGVDQTTKGLFGSISNYFATVKTNGRKILHLYYLVWLRGISYLVTLLSQI